MDGAFTPVLPLPGNRAVVSFSPEVFDTNNMVIKRIIIFFFKNFLSGLHKKFVLLILTNLSPTFYAIKGVPLPYI